MAARSKTVPLLTALGISDDKRNGVAKLSGLFVAQSVAQLMPIEKAFVRFRVWRPVVSC
jgi:hypothetical protein